MTNTITRSFHLFLSRLKSCSSSSPVARREDSHDPSSLPSSLSSSSSSSSSTPIFKNSTSSPHDPSSTAGTSHSDAGSTSATFFTSTTDSNSFAGDMDLTSAIACRRLLLPSSPRRSNAIADPSTIPVGFSVAVPTYSSDPYREFRRSMEEMAAQIGLLDLHETHSCREERLYELLLCYLALNRKHAHKYIISAFADLFAATSKSAVEVDDADGEEEGVGE